MAPASPEDLTVDNITPHVIRTSTNVSNERTKFLFSKLIQCAHDYVRDVDLKTHEWEAAWQYLTDVWSLHPASELSSPTSDHINLC